MTDIVKRLREAQFNRVFDDAFMGRDPLPLDAAADEIERLREVLRRALHLHDIEQAERPTPNVPAWVEDARTLLTEARDA